MEQNYIILGTQALFNGSCLVHGAFYILCKCTPNFEQRELFKYFWFSRIGQPLWFHSLVDVFFQYTFLFQRQTFDVMRCDAM